MRLYLAFLTGCLVWVGLAALWWAGGDPFAHGAAKGAPCGAGAGIAVHAFLRPRKGVGD